MTVDQGNATRLSGPIDRFDQRILDVLSREGRLSVTALAERIGLSKTPTQTRLRRLEAEGLILGYRAVVNAAALGRDHVAFTEVKLSDTREAALSAFNGAVRAIPEVESCHLIAGAFDYLLKTRTTGIRAYRQVLAERISMLPHVASTSTFVAMEAVVEEGAAYRGGEARRERRVAR